MRIIKNGNYKKENTVVCDQCNCEFQYFNTEIITETSSPEESEMLGGFGVHKYVRCPTCNNIITIACTFVEYISIFDKLAEWLNKKRIKKGVDNMANTIAFDFDGVIHRYSRGWQDGNIYDHPTKGIDEVISKLRKNGYKVVIYSTRGATKKGIREIKDWLEKYNIVVDDICSEKPIASMYVDDRAIPFNGNCETLLKDIDRFQVWTDKSRKTCAYCGEEFFVDDIYNNRKRYCSDECRINANRYKRIIDTKKCRGDENTNEE